MIVRLRPFLLLIALLTAAAPALADPLVGSLDQRARQQVETLFGTARAALAAGDGPTLLAQLSRRSLMRLEAVRNAARLGDAAPLTGLGPSEKLGVLGLRRHFSATDLRRLRTADLVGRLLAGRWLRPATVRETQLGDITVAGNEASAPLLIDGRPSLADAHFVREGGGWHLDLTRTAATADSMLRLLIQFSGQPEDAYLGHLLDRWRR